MKVRVILLLVVLLIDLLAWGARAAWAPESSGTLDPARMAREQGFAFTAKIDAPPSRWTHLPNDGAGLSRLRLVEVNGDQRVELGPAHAPPDRVRDRGGGAFNHWGEILFSTSDGSDPRTNGRRYEWESPCALHPRLALVLLALTAAALLWALSGLFERWPRARKWFFLGTVLVLAIAWNLEVRRLYPQWINVDWDTASYLGRSPERTIGYWLLIELISLPSGDLRWMLVVQLNALLASFAFLGRAVDRLLGSRVVGWAVFVLLATSPRLMSFPFSVLTESFYATGLSVMLALLCLAARSWRDGGDARAAVPGRSARMALLASSSAVLAITELVRPAALGLAAMLLLPLLWARGERLRALAAVVLPYAVIIAAASFANERRFGFFATSAMGPVSLLGHVAWNINAKNCPELPELADRIERRIAPILARRPATLAWPKEYFFWTSDEFNELLWANAMPETHAWVEEQARLRPIENETVERLRVRSTLAKSALRADPWAYLRHVGAHLWGFWQSVARPTPLGPGLKGRVPRGEASVANLWPQVREARFGWLGPAPRVDASDTPFDRLTWMEWWRTPLDANPSILWKLAVAATLVGVALAPISRRLTSVGRLLALAGTGFQGTALLVAAATAVIARYVDAVEPLTVVACAAALMAIGETIGRLARAPRVSADAPRSHPQ